MLLKENIFQVTFTWQICNRIKYLSSTDFSFLVVKPVILLRDKSNLCKIHTKIYILHCMALWALILCEIPSLTR